MGCTVSSTQGGPTCQKRNVNFDLQSCDVGSSLRSIEQEHRTPNFALKNEDFGTSSQIIDKSDVSETPQQQSFKSRSKIRTQKHSTATSRNRKATTQFRSIFTDEEREEAERLRSARLRNEKVQDEVFILDSDTTSETENRRRRRLSASVTTFHCIPMIEASLASPGLLGEDVAPSWMSPEQQLQEGEPMKPFRLCPSAVSGRSKSPLVVWHHPENSPPYRSVSSPSNRGEQHGAGGQGEQCPSPFNLQNRRRTDSISHESSSATSTLLLTPFVTYSDL